MCDWALYHIFPLSVESVVDTERAPGCPEGSEGIDDADKSEDCFCQDRILKV